MGYVTYVSLGRVSQLTYASGQPLLGCEARNQGTVAQFAYVSQVQTDVFHLLEPGSYTLPQGECQSKERSLNYICRMGFEPK